MKSWALLFLILATVACSLSENATVATVPVTETPPARTPVPAVTQSPVPIGSLLASGEACVQSIGLWLRSSPEIADNNKLLALPQGTKVRVVSSGIWSRVYLKPIDLYGYVKSQYLGECP